MRLLRARNLYMHRKRLSTAEHSMPKIVMNSEVR